MLLWKALCIPRFLSIHTGPTLAKAFVCLQFRSSQQVKLCMGSSWSRMGGACFLKWNDSYRMEINFYKPNNLTCLSMGIKIWDYYCFGIDVLELSPTKFPTITNSYYSIPKIKWDCVIKAPSTVSTKGTKIRMTTSLKKKNMNLHYQSCYIMKQDNLDWRIFFTLMLYTPEILNM
jgi:hypothetical protein